MKTVYGACLRYLTNSTGYCLSEEKAFTSSKLLHSTHYVVLRLFILRRFVLNYHLTCNSSAMFSQYLRSTKEERFLISWVACYRVGPLCTQAKADPCFFVPWFTFSAPFWMTSQFRCAKHSASWFKLYLRHKQLSYGNHVHHWFHQGQLHYTGIFEFGKRMNVGVVF